MIKYLPLLMSLLYAAYASAGGSDTSHVKFENPQTVRHVIKSNPIAILWGSIPFTAEYRYVQEIPTARFQSSQIGFSYIGKSIVLYLAENVNRQNNEPRITVSGFRMQFMHRFFFTREEYAPSGPYIGPHISYTTAKFSTRFASVYENYVQATHFNVSLLGGYQIVSDDWYAADVFFGLGYKKNKWEEHYYNGQNPINLDNFPFYNSPVKITAGFNVGLAF